LNHETPKYSLQINAGDAKGKTVPLSLGEFIVGRLEECYLVLGNDGLISRKHAKFTVDAQGCWVENLGSLNGVYVNKRKIEKRHPLTPGDEIIIGNHLLVLHSGWPSGTPSIQPHSPKTPASQTSSSLAKTPMDSTRRIHLLYQLVQATLNSNSQEGLMKTILDLIFQDLRVERGCIMLIHPQTQQIKPVCFKVRGEEQKVLVFHPSPDLVSQALNEKKTIVRKKDSLQGSPLNTAIILPIMEGLHIYGCIYLDTTHSNFEVNKSDLDFLEAIAKQSTIALYKANLATKLQEEQELINKLEKHVGAQVTKIVRERKVDINRSDFETQEKEVAILFSDIVGFTSLSEKLSPSETAFLLNGYFNYMADCVAKYNGYLNKYIGDAVMAVFGAPHSVKNDSENAIRCAIEMLQKLKVFWKSIDEKKRFQIRIGINTGIVTAGNIGSLSRMEYTVIGDAVNLASRLESNAPPNSIIIGETTHQKAVGLFPVKQLGSIKVKGKEAPVQIYQILMAP